MNPNAEIRPIELHSPLDHSFSPEAIQEALNRILRSKTFRLAEGQKAFLHHTVKETLAGRSDLLKEYVIGVEAFGRGDLFDPRLDPIVRTQARKLRANLEKYYAAEGSNDPVRISFPKGSYAPKFFRPEGDKAQAIPDSISPPSLQSADVVVAPARPTETPATPLLPKRNRYHFGFMALVLVLVSLVFAVWHSFRSVSPIHFASGDLPYLAVLPFANLSHDGEGELTSDGLTHDLIELLKQRPGLRIVPLRSVSEANAASRVGRDNGRKVKVGFFLVGSVRKSADRLRITIQLNDRRNSYHYWTGSFEPDLHNLRGTEWEIANAVSNVLEGSPLPTEQELAKTVPHLRSPSAGAYENYLKGLHFWHKFTSENLWKAEEYFEKAIAEDPSFARAYVALANCYVLEPQVTGALPMSVVPKIEDAAARALRLDPALGEAHIDMAVSAEYQFDWSKAEAEFRQGLALSPRNVEGHLWYAKFLAIVGRRDEVFRERKVAAELDPVSPYAIQAVGGYLSVMGRYDEAIQYFNDALTLDPSFGLAHQGLGMAYLLKGMPESAISELKIANQTMAGPRRLALLGYVYAISGKTLDARKILDSFLAQSQSKSFPALAIAQIYIGLGDRDHAFEWLGKAVDQRDLDFTMQWDSPYVPLRSDPRAHLLLKRMRLG